MIKLTGRMVSFETWKRFILASDGSDAMKDLVICHINARLPGDLLDSFLLGLEIGELSNKFAGDNLIDFWKTTKLTRDLNNVPIVQIDGEPVA